MLVLDREEQWEWITTHDQILAQFLLEAKKEGLGLHNLKLTIGEFDEPNRKRAETYRDTPYRGRLRYRKS